MTHAEEIRLRQDIATNKYVNEMIDTTRAPLEAEISRLQISYNEASGTVTRLQGELTTANQRLTSTQTERDQLRTNLTAETAKVTSLNTQLGTATNAALQLQKEIDRLKLQIIDLQKGDGTLEFWGKPVFQENFTNGLEQWNVRDNFTTIDTARAMKSNAVVRDGSLHLLGTWLDTPVAGGPRGIFTHNTGYVDTRKLADAANPTPKHFSQRWGRWEARAKLPTDANTRGALAAFWLRADNHPGEIDIMEAWGGGGTMAADWTTYIKDSAVTTIHSSTNGAGSTVNGKQYRKTFWRHWQHGVPRSLNDGQFHVFAFELTPSYMAQFVDGIEVARVTPSSPDPVNKVNSVPNPSGTLAWLWDTDFFGSPLHIRLNLHIGPSTAYWGIPDVNNRALTKPLDFEIDYVRAYALPAGA